MQEMERYTDVLAPDLIGAVPVVVAAMMQDPPGEALPTGVRVLAVLMEAAQAQLQMDEDMARAIRQGAEGVVSVVKSLGCEMKPVTSRNEPRSQVFVYKAEPVTTSCHRFFCTRYTTNIIL